jgi:hypothetical protein
MSTTISTSYSTEASVYNSALTITQSGTVAGVAGRGIDGITLINEGLILTSWDGNDVYVEGPGYVSNSGTMIGDIRNVYLFEGGSVSNSGTMTDTYSENVEVKSVGSVSNYGLMITDGTDNVYLENGGYVSNSGTMISSRDNIGITGAAGTAVNTGTLEGGFGIELEDGGTGTNSGVITGEGGLGAGGTYASYLKNTGIVNVIYDGMELVAPGTAVNAGTILVSGAEVSGIILENGGLASNSGSISISGDSTGITSYGGTVNNSGNITTGTLSVGIFARIGGLVVNSGTIISGREGIILDGGATLSNTGSSSVISGIYGGVVAGQGSTVFNAGTILGIRSNSYGISLQGAGTIINSGTISGAGEAVDFSGSGDDRLIIDPGAVFIGNISAGGSGNTLEFASGSSAGTLAGIGGSITGFATIALDAGASWNLTANVAGLAEITGFSAGDSIDLTGFAATQATLGTYAGETELVLSNASASYTITLAGGTAQLAVESDGSGGAELVAATPNLLGVGIANGVTLTANGAYQSSFTITSFGAIDTNGSYGVFTTLSAATLINSGVVESGLAAAVLYAGGAVSNLGTGAIIAAGFRGVDIVNGAGTVTNQGTITAGSNAGVYLGIGGTVSNSGATALIRGSYGIEINQAAGTVLNSGTILATGRYGVLLFDGGSVGNTGTAALISGQDAGVDIRGTGTADNAGTILSTLADGGRQYFAVNLAGGGTLTNSGMISGVDSGVNFGGSGNDLLVEMAGAVIHGSITASGSGNVLELASSTNASSGTIGQFTGFDTIQIDAGATWDILGGSAALASGETITGFGLGDAIDLTDFAATSGSYVVGRGLVLSNGLTTETVSLSGDFEPVQLAFISDGAGGTEILDNGHLFSQIFTAGITLTASGNYPSPFTLSSLGTIAPGGGNAVYSALAGAALTDDGLITNSSGIGVELTAGGTVAIGGTGKIEAGQDAVYIFGAAGTVINAGQLSGNQAVVFDYGGFVTNSASGTIIANGSAIAISRGAGTVVNAGTITATLSGPAIYIDRQAGQVSNLGTAARITGEGYGVKIGGLGTVTNTGTIIGYQNAGVLLQAGGTVSNNATAASIYGKGYGVQIEGNAGYVYNAGTIAGGQIDSGVGVNGTGTVINSGTAASIHGGYYGVDIGGSGTVLNAGTITSRYGLVYSNFSEQFTLREGAGIEFNDGGILQNEGTASLIRSVLYGVRFKGAAGTVVNAGTIAGTTFDGVALLDGGTVTNSGVISGGVDAVYFGGTGGNALIVDAGAVFGGAVVAKGSGNVLELTSISGGGMISSIGSQFTGFQTIALDANSTWDISGNIAGLASGETITGFTIGDTISLTGFAATSETIVNGTLMVLSDGSNFETLDVTGGFQAGLISISTNGTDTEITDPESHTLSTPINTGITLVQSGGFDSPFTITQTGAVYSNSGYFSEAVYSSVNGATLVNYGGVTGANGYGIEFSNGGYVANSGAAATISGEFTGIGIFGSDPGTVFNSGTVSGDYGVKLSGADGALINSGAAALISGAEVAAYLEGGATVINEGTLAGTGEFSDGLIIGNRAGSGGYIENKSGALISGYYVGVGAYTGISLVNQGTIISHDPSGGRGGIYMRYGGTVMNTGAQAVISGYNAGVYADNNSGTVVNAGTILATSNTSGDGVKLLSGGTVINSGTISGGKYAVYFSDNRGEFYGIPNGYDLLEVDPGAVFIGNVTASGADNTLELGSAANAGSLTGIGTQFQGFDTIALDLGSAWSLSGNIAGLASGQTITGFVAGDTIDIAGLTLASSETLSLGPDGVLSIPGTTDTLTFTGISELESFTLSSDGEGGTDITDTLCYLRGTRILTTTSEVPVEDIRIGDRLVTRFGAVRPVRWIGRQSYDLRFVRDNKAKLPVCIQAGALGEKMPARDLFVSPGHSMLLDGTLVLASKLVNGLTITQSAEKAPARIEYFQIEFDSHDCVIAEGTWSETYADAPGMRAQFHNAAEFYDLYPDQPPREELYLCAPRPERGAKLDAAIRPVVARATVGLAPGRFEGWIDNVSDWRIEGWALDHDHPELPVLLQVLIGERIIGTVLACDARADLAAAGIGNGNRAFFHASPVRIPVESWADLRLRRACDGAPLQMTPACRERIAKAQPTHVPVRLRAVG